MSEKPRLLLIDDDAILRGGIRVYLEDSGYEVIEAADGREGVACAREELPDLILCDLRMPGLDGNKVLETLRDLRDEVPLIVITGQGVLQDAITALRHGAWDFITKPIKEMEVLEISIKRALERARLVRENRLYRERLEEQVEERTRELQENEARMRSIFASLHRSFVMLFEANGTCTDLEGPPGLAEHYGVSLPRSGGLHLGQYLEPRHFREHQKAVQSVFETGTPVVLELPLKLPGGDLWFEITHSAMRDSTGHIAAVVGFFSDVTKRHEAEDEKTRLEVQLRQAQKLEAIGTLAGGIAHDFNNILSAILGFTHIALQDTQHLPQLNSALQEVYTAGKRAAALVKQILTFSRRHEQQRAPLMVAPIVKEAMKLLRISLPANIEIRQEVDSDCGAILGDPTELHQVLLNLGTNAYHAMRHLNRGQLHLRVRRLDLAEDGLLVSEGLPPGRWVHLRMQDSGMGMSPEVMEHIFEPFFTTKPVGEGTGMGLSIVHGIVTSSGGKIFVSSAPDQGTCFDVYLPRLASDSEIVPQHERPLKRGTGRILFVDDEEPLVMLGEVVLERLGYHVTGCREVLRAIEFFKIDPDGFDCVITDQTMPQMTGLALARELRLIRPDVPIILMTGHSEEAIGRQASANDGVSAVLAKPLDSHALADTLYNLLASQPG